LLETAKLDRDDLYINLGPWLMLCKFLGFAEICPGVLPNGFQGFEAFAWS